MKNVKKRIGRRLAAAAAGGALVVGLLGAPVLPAQAARPSPDPTPLELRNAQLSCSAGAQGMVLLENERRALPLPGSKRMRNVAVFGVGSYATSKVGTGAADVYSRYFVNLRQGFENAGYRVTTSPAYWNAITTAFDGKYKLTDRNIDYASVEQPLTSETVRPSRSTDTAVVIVTRGWTGGADKSPGPGGYRLSAVEEQNLRLVAARYQRVVVVLNTGSVFDSAFYDTINASVKDPRGGQAIDGLLLAGLPGQEVGNAIVDVLDGRVNPSGKLTDTWASSYDHYPASATFSDHDGDIENEQYSEGIYIGYRYFDSFYRKLAKDPKTVVSYPFGYGLSYSDFAIKPLRFTADAKRVRVTVRVTNIGRVSGKEIAQVYFSAPQQGLDKPYQELGGFAKTGTLKPGASQTLTISFDTTEMSSFDEHSSSWVMDPGRYVIRVGNSSRNTRVAGTAELKKRVVTEVVSPQLKDMRPDSVLESDPADFYSYPGEAAEIARAPRVALPAHRFRTVRAKSPNDQNVAVDSDSPYYAVDGSTISSITTYLPAGQKDWEGTGAPYSAKTGETVKRVKTKPDATLYDVAAGRVSMQQFVAGLSVSQLADIVEASPGGGSIQHAVGAAGFTTAKYESLGIPSMSLVDGGSGLRITPVIDSTPPAYQYATAWPASITLAQSWDLGLFAEVAKGLGREMVEFGATMWLAPGLNIHRDPLGGRNWMYYAEDPLLTGVLGAEITRGIQKFPGRGVTLKHFAGNNQETGRDKANTIGDERGLREIELKSFEISIKNAPPMGVMTAYNLLQGQYTAQNYDLLMDVLRGEWGYRGFVMSDWGGSHDALATLYSGNDLISPGNAPQDVIDRLMKTLPTIEQSGLPVYNKTVRPSGDPTYTWMFGGLQPSATGTQVVTTRVDSTTSFAETPASGTTVIDAMGNQKITPDPKFASVDDAYRRVQDIVASNALSEAQKAAISIVDVQREVADDSSSPVVAYTVELRGEYNSTFDMRLGDVQRSAANILRIVMQSSSFQQLAAMQDVRGVKVRPYLDQFRNLKNTLIQDHGRIIDRPRGR